MSEKTIQISVYDWKNMKEYIYESTVSSVEDMIALYYKFNRQVKFKKPTDKNWYYCKTMIKRLFKSEINKDFDIRLKDVRYLGKI